MNALLDDPAIEVAACPMHAAASSRRSLQAADELVLPKSKRMLTQYATGGEGGSELRLYYDDKEISFDEPELFTFGEALAKQDRFIAAAASSWGVGLEWLRVRDLLATLIDAGILQYADRWTDEERAIGKEGARPSPLPPVAATSPRTWQESEEITAELAGRALETGYLELAVPIFRVAHMALDAEGRQVGESNVFPPALRLDIPTRWRTCIYAGTRYQVDRPMNVTALKNMRAHWGQMMGALLAIRAAYLARFPAARDGWTIGHLERLSVTVLALPTYLLMRREKRIENGDLHPALSSLFRVTDGLRMTLHQMLFVPIGEPARSPDAPMTSAEIYAYAERNYSFHSAHGVCAGPRVMVEEFFSVLVDGQLPKGGLPAEFDPQVQAALADLDPVIDYALLGLKAYAVTFSVWPLMTRAYETLGAITAAWAASGPATVGALRDRLQGPIERIAGAAFLATEDRRADRERVYADMYAQCSLGLTGKPALPALPERIAPTPLASGGGAARQLRVVLERHFSPASGAAAPHLDEFLACLMVFLRQVQAILRVACETQREINALLGRTPPARPFSAADIDIHNQLRGDADSRAPYLIDELEDIFAIRITLDKDVLEITDTHIAAAA